MVDKAYAAGILGVAGGIVQFLGSLGVLGGEELTGTPMIVNVSIGAILTFLGVYYLIQGYKARSAKNQVSVRDSP